MVDLLYCHLGSLPVYSTLPQDARRDLPFLIKKHFGIVPRSLARPPDRPPSVVKERKGRQARRRSW